MPVSPVFVWETETGGSLAIPSDLQVQIETRTETRRQPLPSPHTHTHPKTSNSWRTSKSSRLDVKPLRLCLSVDAMNQRQSVRNIRCPQGGASQTSLLTLQREKGLTGVSSQSRVMRDCTSTEMPWILRIGICNLESLVGQEPEI